MLTTRGWWLLLCSLGLLLLGGLLPPAGHGAIALIGLSLLFWFLGSWLIFTLRTRYLVRSLTVQRELWDERGRVDNLWVGKSVRVVARVQVHGIASVPWAIVTDRVPFGAEYLRGDVQMDAPLSSQTSVVLSYFMRCLAPGCVRFEGVHLQLADLQGFFYRTAFVQTPAICRVMPPLVDARGKSPTVKRHNLLPPPGVHRMRRPGTGSELLDLRDYMPGDPPKMIAWKASARRDRLITKEFESEVPIRCTLFVDVSPSVRLGPPGRNALSRLVDIASAVAQASVGARDLIGLALFDDQTSSYVRPARTTRHLVQMLAMLSEAATLQPATVEAPAADLLPLAYAFAREVYPDRLRADVNAFPFWLAWLFPRPAYSMRSPRPGDRAYRWLPWLLGLYGFLALIVTNVIVAIVIVCAFISPFLFLAAAALALLGLAVLYTSIPAALFFPGRRRAYAQRKQLAALLSARHGLAPGGLALLLEDDNLFSHHVQRFLIDHQVPYRVPCYDALGRYLFAAPEKVEVLAQALLRATGRGHDNELFVLLVDLLELEDHMGPLLRSIKVALARHHRVLVLCPWQPGVPLPPSRTMTERAVKRSQRQAGTRFEQQLHALTTSRLHRAFQRVRHSLGKLGVSLLCAQSGDSTRIILERLDQLRTQRSSR